MDGPGTEGVRLDRRHTPGTSQFLVLILLNYVYLCRNILNAYHKNRWPYRSEPEHRIDNLPEGANTLKNKSTKNMYLCTTQINSLCAPRKHVDLTWDLSQKTESTTSTRNDPA